MQFTALMIVSLITLEKRYQVPVGHVEFPNLTQAHLGKLVERNFSIHVLINRPNFLEKCDKWCERVTEDGFWKDFQMFDGKEFLALPNNLAIVLRCDWFQPYKHVTYSVGVLYLVIFNLPREERFKMENIIVLGIISGPSEPKNLGPFVRDMLDLRRGKNLA